MKGPEQSTATRKAIAPTICLGLSLLGVGWFLLASYSLMVWSDPTQWYDFGKHFFELFGAKDLAYGFPLVVWCAIQTTGLYSAFLVNIPILVVLCALVHRLGSALVRETDIPNPAPFAHVGGLASLLLFVVVDRDLLVFLANPYRDPLAMVWMLASILALIAFRARPRHPLWLAGAGGLFLALACSTRETSILVALPLVLYALAAKARDRSLPLIKPAIVFILVFVVAMIPYALQNHLVSGNAFIPAQAAGAANSGNSLLPGMKPDRVRTGILAVLQYLAGHYGGLVIALFLAGSLLAWRQRSRAILCIFLPAALLYAVIYAAYKSVVARYLFAVDLFVVPVAGFTLAMMLRAAATRIPKVAGKTLTPRVLCPALTALTIAIMIGTVLQDNTKRFRLNHARQLTETLRKTLVLPAVVVAEKPFGSFVKCFLDIDALTLQYMTQSRSLGHPMVAAKLHTIVDDSDRTYLLSASEARRAFMLGEFDLEPLNVFHAADFGLAEVIQSSSFALDIVRPWTSTQAQASLELPAPAAVLLSADFGNLRAWSPRQDRVCVNDRLFDQNPFRMSFYPLPLANRTDINVVLSSSRPVPSEITLRALPERTRLRLDFSPAGLMKTRDRLSKSFLAYPDEKYPGVSNEGFIWVPLPYDSGDVILAKASIAMTSQAHKLGHFNLAVSSQGKTLWAGPVDNPKEKWKNIAWIWPAGDHAANTTRLDWKMTSPDIEGALPLCMVGELMVQGVDPSIPPDIDIGSDEDEMAILNGFHDREVDPSGETFRWTAQRAAIRLISPDRKGRLTLGIRFREKVRPKEAPPPRTRFYLQDKLVSPELEDLRPGGTDAWEARVEFDADDLNNGLVVLGIEVDTFNPAALGMNSDNRNLGIQVSHVWLKGEGIEITHPRE